MSTAAVQKKNETITLHKESEETEIDLLELGMALLEKWHLIAMCFMIGAVILNLYSYLLVKPTYQSTAKMYVVAASNDSVVNLQDLNLGTSLTADYEELILSYPVLSKVIKKLKLDMTTEDLTQMIMLENPADTRVLRVTVTSTDPVEAKDIANEVVNVAETYLPETMSTPAPNIAEKARVAEYKSAPSNLKFTLIGGMLGLLVAAGWVIFTFMMDDTIHSAEDMEKAFGIVPLTTIPENKAFNQSDTGEMAETVHRTRYVKRKHRRGNK